MVEAVLGPPTRMVIAMQAFGAPDYPKVRVVTKTRYGTRSKQTRSRACLVWLVRAFAPTPYEGGGKLAHWLNRIANGRLRFSGLYSREKVAPGNFDWDSLSNPNDPRVGGTLSA